MKRVHLLFDLDGTLLDSREGTVRSIRFALDEVGLHDVPEHELDSCVGPPLLDSLKRLLGPDRGHQIPAALEHYQRHFESEGIRHILPYGGIQECLDALGDSAHLYVVTSNLTHLSETLLSQCGLKDRFIRILGAQDWNGAGKARLIAELLHSENLPAHSTVMIGDRRFDVEGALRNGVLPIGILWGYGTAEELRSAGAETLFHRPDHLARHFTAEDRPRSTQFSPAARRG